jgi:hypothetical protein
MSDNERENPYGDVTCEACHNRVTFQFGTRSDVVCRWGRWDGDEQGCGKILIKGSHHRSPSSEMLICPKCKSETLKPFNAARWPFGRIRCQCGELLRSRRVDDNLQHSDNEREDSGTNTPPPRELGSDEE